ncbi:Hypothetical predicted protein [Octopus vulgaris]|uniref:Uncharacterized protein n=1 Tax=Octopus vulgaris TaxID=6645 RepID=A0AA36B553_OCTVU|nr:Hypothetical predicted protein [Octopus vulgaris]
MTNIISTQPFYFPYRIINEEKLLQLRMKASWTILYQRVNLVSVIQLWIQLQKEGRVQKIDPDIFRYIFGNFTPQIQMHNTNNFVKKVYLAYFKVALGDQEKTWDPHEVCKTCAETLCDEAIHQSS